MFLILVTRIGGSGYLIQRVARKNFVTDNLNGKTKGGRRKIAWQIIQ